MTQDTNEVLVHADRRACITSPILHAFAKAAGHRKLPRKIFVTRTEEGLRLAWKGGANAKSYDLSVRDRVLVGGFKKGQRLQALVRKNVLEIKPSSAKDHVAGGRREDHLGEALSFLQDLLKGGPVAQTQVLKAARSKGLAPRTLRRALKICGRTKQKNRAWFWELLTQPMPEETTPPTTLTETKRERLKAKGWKVGDVQEFLGLSDSEMIEVETRRGARKVLSEEELLALLKRPVSLPASPEPFTQETKDTILSGVCSDVRTHYGSLPIKDAAKVLDAYWPGITVDQFLTENETTMPIFDKMARGIIRQQLTPTLPPPPPAAKPAPVPRPTLRSDASDPGAAVSMSRMMSSVFALLDPQSGKTITDLAFEIEQKESPDTHVDLQQLRMLLTQFVRQGMLRKEGNTRATRYFSISH